ncbi:ORF6N domain-containing protein [Wolinella succinogenes]|uniref:ORF6N domain-containing protein n=1 Tax=Wolinella succinogenes TaxID=844 RepID=UPI0024091BF1|nr:ORF6N domain-containing protein [Wolinella succinogenes]
MDVIVFDKIEEKIIELNGEKVILDSDVAELYGVSTKEINQAVSNNPNKFPDGYIVETDKDIKNELVKNFDRFSKLKHSSVNPKAFTERGLYITQSRSAKI